MDNELDAFAFGDTDLEKTTVLICADQHHKIAKVEHPYWVSVGVQHVLVLDPVLASTVQNHGIHTIKLT
jgi:hypothetical protein